MKIQCPECGATLRVADANLGKMGRCPKCRHQFRLSAGPADAAVRDAAAPAARGVAADADEGSGDLYQLAAMAEMERAAPAAPDPAAFDPAGFDPAAPDQQVRAGTPGGAGATARPSRSTSPGRPGSPAPASRIIPPSQRPEPQAPTAKLGNIAALRIGSLILCCALPLCWLLPWGKVTNDLSSMFRVSINGRNAVRDSTTSTGLSMAWHRAAVAASDDASLVLGLVGLVMFGVGAIAAGAVALLSVRSWQMSRTWPGAAAATLGVLLFLAGTGSSSARAFNTSVTGFVYLVLLVGAVATLLGLLQVDWSSLSSRMRSAPAAPAAPAARGPAMFRQSFGGEQPKAQTADFSPLTIAAGVIALLPLVCWYLPWSVKPGMPGAYFAQTWPSDLPESSVSSLRIGNDDMRDKAQKAITGAKVAVFGTRTFGAAAFASAILGIVLLSLGGANFRFAGAGGLLACLGVVIFLVGILYAASQIPGKHEDAAFGWGFYAACICAAGCAISGFMAQKP